MISIEFDQSFIIWFPLLLLVFLFLFLSLRTRSQLINGNEWGIRNKVYEGRKKDSFDMKMEGERVTLRRLVSRPRMIKDFSFVYTVAGQQDWVWLEAAFHACIDNTHTHSLTPTSLLHIQLAKPRANLPARVLLLMVHLWCHLAHFTYIHYTRLV